MPCARSAVSLALAAKAATALAKDATRSIVQRSVNRYPDPTADSPLPRLRLVRHPDPDDPDIHAVVLSFIHRLNV